MRKFGSLKISIFSSEILIQTRLELASEWHSIDQWPDPADRHQNQGHMQPKGTWVLNCYG